MGLVAPGGTFVWPNLLVLPTGSPVGLAAYPAMTASGYTTSIIIQSPATGTISYIGFRAGASTGGVVTVSLQTVNSSGQPTGTMYGGSTASANQSLTTNTPYEVALGTPATTTVGDLIAVVWTYVSGTTMIIEGDYQATLEFPFGWAYNGSTFTPERIIALATLGYSAIGSGGSGYVPIQGGAPAIEGYTATAYNSGSAIFRRALKITAPWDMTVVGCWVDGLWAASSSVLMNLRDSGNTSQASVTINQAQAFNTNNTRIAMFANSYNLANGSVYRLSMEPQNTNNFTAYEWTFANSYQYSNPINNLPGGTDAVLSTYTAGSWLDSAAARPMCGLLVSAVPQSASSGGAFVPMPMGVM